MYQRLIVEIGMHESCEDFDEVGSDEPHYPARSKQVLKHGGGVNLGVYRSEDYGATHRVDDNEEKN